MLQEYLIQRKIATKKFKFLEKLQVSNTKTKEIFFKKKMVSNDSKSPNSARNLHIFA